MTKVIWVHGRDKSEVKIIQQMEIVGSLRQNCCQNSNNHSIHRFADEKLGVKIIHRKSSVGRVAKV